MKPPRDMWISWKPFQKDPLGQCMNVLRLVTDYEFEDAIHVREVREIDWEKVWAVIDEMAIEDITGCNNDTKGPIQQLVEQQIKGGSTSQTSEGESRIEK